MHARGGRSAPWGLTLMMAAGACTGEVVPGREGSAPGSVPGSVPGDPGPSSGPSGPGGPGGPGAGGPGRVPGLDQPVVPAPAARIARLTHDQWRHTVRDLFGLSDAAPDWAASFRADANGGGFLFGNEAASLEVDEALEAAYRRAAQDVAAYLTDGPELTRLAPWLPPSGDDRARAEALIDALGPRVHRRPLSAAEREAYLAVFDVGAAYPRRAPPLVGGLRLVLEAFLASPRFLYRIEASARVEESVIPLDDYEVAARLSYALWDTMPDPTLFEAAAAGELGTAEQVRAQAERMLDDPRAASVNQRFHRLLLDVARYDAIDPDPGDHPGVTDRLPSSAREETERVLAAAFDEGRGWRSLLTTDETFVDAELARIYGVEPPPTGFSRVRLPTAERRGLFTQVGFLASHATRFQPDPIHRGVFLTERIACNPLGAPPAELPPLPPPRGRTNREVVADHTEQPGTVCASCHSTLINPFGFPYEGFDAAGRVRTTDAGRPVETQAEPMLAGARVPVADALELADVMARNPAVHACYARHWVEYAFGRGIRPEDQGLVARLGQASLEGASIKDLLVQMVASPAFFNRSTEEL